MFQSCTSTISSSILRRIYIHLHEGIGDKKKKDKLQEEKEQYEKNYREKLSSKEDLLSMLDKELEENLEKIKNEEVDFDKNMSSKDRKFLNKNLEVLKNVNLDNQTLESFLNEFEKEQTFTNVVDTFEKTAKLDLQLSGRKVTVTTLGGFHNLFETVQTQEFQIAKTQINKYFEENQFHFTKIEGPGLYMGKTIVYYKKEKITINCLYKKNRWFETLQTKLDKTIKNILELQNATMSYFSGQFIVHDILDCVEWNEDYITDSAIARQLRTMGRWDNHSSSRVYYENYSATEIKEIIQELIKKDFLTTRTHKGRYGKFETLKLGNEKLDTVEISDFDEFEEEKWNDYKAEYIFEKYTKKETLELKEYLVLLKFVTCKGFVAKYGTQYLELLKTGPETFKKVVKMKRDTETDEEIKKFYRKILRK